MPANARSFAENVDFGTRKVLYFLLMSRRTQRITLPPSLTPPLTNHTNELRLESHGAEKTFAGTRVKNGLRHVVYGVVAVLHVVVKISSESESGDGDDLLRLSSSTIVGQV